VAVRRSATAEEVPEASFAGQQATNLNVRGETALPSAVRSCFASLFTDRVVVYRQHDGFDQMAVRGAVAVQLMVRPDLGSESVEAVVAGSVDADERLLCKPAVASASEPASARRRNHASTLGGHGSEFKSHEYRRLVGANAFEPVEENPMIGLRGASRYTPPRFAEAFEMEYRALKHVRDDVALTNVELIVRFCRTAAEGQKVPEPPPMPSLPRTLSSRRLRHASSPELHLPAEHSRA
jgi:phosphoenolpyruvate synthase/pyruvate phosphate dikinase